MGLDMYLDRAPRYKDTTPSDLSKIEGYWDYQVSKAQEKTKGYSLKEWSGIDESALPDQEYLDFYCPFYTIKYSDWDTEKKYGFGRISEQVGYWRKANQIHNWFVENVQDGNDDCGSYEVSKEDLEALLATCADVLADPSQAESLLPTTGGFFFGDTEYDEYYMQDIKETINILTKVIAETDFEKQMVYYVSSW